MKTKKAILTASILFSAFILQGCNTLYFHTSPGVVYSKKVNARPVVESHDEYDNEYSSEYYDDDQYGDDYYTKTEFSIYFGTSIYLGGLNCGWCGYCDIWHPRCYSFRCYCAPTVIRHYGFYHNNIYVNHCFRWNYDPYFRPIVSRYRFRNADRYYSYRPAQRKRNFAKNNRSSVYKSRTEYRGKEIIKHTKRDVEKITEDRFGRKAINKRRNSSGNISKGTGRLESRKRTSKRSTYENERNKKESTERKALLLCQKSTLLRIQEIQCPLQASKSLSQTFTPDV